MEKPLHILHLEDDPDYFDLVRATLEKEGLQVEIRLVGNYADFVAALEKEPFDIILADYTLPTCNGIQALQLVLQKCPDTPILLVSGTIGEQAAIESLKRGATDYVLKHSPDRLVPAVRRAVQEAQEKAQRKQAEAALRSSELLFHSVWQNSVDGMRLTDENGVVVAVNSAFCKSVGVSREELEGKPFTIIYADSERPEQILEKYRQNFRARFVERQVERSLVLGNGHAIVLEESNSFVKLPDQSPLLLGLFRDVTVEKRLEEELRQSQKLEGIGQLAGGVAHDFNNVLTVIHGHAAMLLMETNLSDSAIASAQQIIASAERAAGLTRQLLAFSRRQVMQPQLLNLNEIVANMTKMLGRILGENIALQVHYWPQPPMVQADAGMMEQVLLNLAVNARDAMPKGGQLAIKISVADIDANQAAQCAEARIGRFVCFSVIDHGCGIAPENLRRVFEPFFTTKDVGKGTGLGLATVYGIVKQHHGWVEVTSELGKGATFRVHLPASAESVDSAQETPMARAVLGGRETVLVVEDEVAVRELVRGSLASLGYKILQAESGLKALKLWRRNRSKIDLLLTDLIMPGRINGLELAEQMWAERPELKVIFTSGYGVEIVGKDLALRPGVQYLQKPYGPQKLALTVRDCLDA